MNYLPRIGMFHLRSKQNMKNSTLILESLVNKYDGPTNP